jgi:nucleoside-diphosphate-sugar epimerase
MRILITGAAGFIGRHCAARLTELGHEVVPVDNLCAQPLVEPPADLWRMDVRELKPEDLDVDAVLHLAALKSVPNSFEEPDQILHNVAVDHHILRTFNAAPRPSRLIVASSCEVYGGLDRPASEAVAPNPRSPYAAGKAAGEHLASVYGTLNPHRQICVLRLHNIFGPYEGGEAVVSRFIDAILDDRPLLIEGAGTQARDFTYIDDACEMIARVLLDPDRPEPLLNIGSGTAVSVMELVERFRDITGGAVTTRHTPERPNEVSAFIADMDRYRERYGQVPSHPLGEALHLALSGRRDLRRAQLDGALLADSVNR